jgi:hypothetical protein
MCHITSKFVVTVEEGTKMYGQNKYILTEHKRTYLKFTITLRTKMIREVYTTKQERFSCTNSLHAHSLHCAAATKQTNYETTISN